MATDLTDIFGNEICVYAQPRQAELQFTAFPGADGLIGMSMGSRGKQLIITGRLRASGANYSAARSNLQAKIDDIENYQFEDIADYSYKNEIYENVQLLKPRLIADSRGKAFFMSFDEVFVDFVCSGIIMI